MRRVEQASHEVAAAIGGAQPTLGRRRLLGLATAAAAAGVSGCKVQTTAPTAPSTGTATGFDIAFPSPQATLPSDKATFRAMLSGGGPGGRFDPIFTAFTKAHPNVTIDNPTTTWDTLNEAVTLGVRNGSAPDLFSKPTTVPMQVAVNGGWCAALEDVIPDFAAWKAGFPAEAFIPGVHGFNGKTYSWTYTSNYSQYGYFLFFNKDLMSKAGVDPTSTPLTWTSVRETAKKITQAGGGESYGLVASGTRLGSIALALAERAGMAGQDMDPKTGRYQYTSPILKSAIELLLAINSDGSMIPGVVSLTQDNAIAKMGEGHTGMQFEGSWCINAWAKNSPDFGYGVAMPPTGDDGVLHHAGIQEGTAAPMVAYAKSKYPGVAGELLRYLGSVDGQVALTYYSSGQLLSEIPEANEKAAKVIKLSAPMAAYRALAQDLLVKLPIPQFVNPDIGQVTLQQKAVTPTINDIVQGVFSGQVKDLDGALKKLQDDSERALDDAIAAVNKTGVKVSRDDYTFPNWDREKDYTKADYGQR